MVHQATAFRLQASRSIDHHLDRHTAGVHSPREGVGLFEQVRFGIPCIFPDVQRIDCKHMYVHKVGQLDILSRYQIPQSKSCNERKKVTPWCVLASKYNATVSQKYPPCAPKQRKSRSNADCWPPNKSRCLDEVS